MIGNLVNKLTGWFAFCKYSLKFSRKLPISDTEGGPMKRYTNEQALVEWFEKKGAICNKAFEKGVRFRPDIRLEDLKIVIEYDGPQHYTDPSIVLSDIERDAFMQERGYRVIRIPYFVQMNEYLWRAMGYPVDRETPPPSFAYPSGFVDTDVFPAHFCKLGIQRYKKEKNWLQKHAPQVLRQIEQTLSYKIATGMHPDSVSNTKIPVSISQGFVTFINYCIDESRRKPMLDQICTPYECDMMPIVLKACAPIWEKHNSLEIRFRIESCLYMIYDVFGSDMATSDFYTRDEATWMASIPLWGYP
jgi:hypothetical protein